MSKALFGWVLPASALGVDSSDSDDDKSQADDSCKEMLKQEKKPSTRIPEEATIDTRELRFWRRLPTLREAPTDQDDEASVGTEGTAELESDDEWDDDDDNDNDWDDTYSIDSSDDEGSLVGEDTYDSWFARTSTTLSSPGDFYFNPTPKDFPIVREPVPAKATEPEDKAEDDSPEENANSPPKFDFWAGITQTFDKVKSFTDDAIKEMCRKAEEAKQKRAEERESKEHNKIEKERESEELAKVAPTSQSLQRKEAERPTYPRRATKKKTKKSPSRTHRARPSQIPIQYMPPRMVREHLHFSSSRNLDIIDSPFNLSRSVFSGGPSLRRSHTHDNLASLNS